MFKLSDLVEIPSNRITHRFGRIVEIRGEKNLVQFLNCRNWVHCDDIRVVEPLLVAYEADLTETGIIMLGAMAYGTRAINMIGGSVRQYVDSYLNELNKTDLAEKYLETLGFDSNSEFGSIEAIHALSGAMLGMRDEQNRYDQGAIDNVLAIAKLCEDLVQIGQLRSRDMSPWIATAKEGGTLALMNRIIPLELIRRGLYG